MSRWSKIAAALVAAGFMLGVGAAPAAAPVALPGVHAQALDTGWD